MKIFLNPAILITYIFIFAFSWIECMGQKSGIKPMHTFLQHHADSTLIFKYESNWMSSPEYWIISKKNDTITRYIYKSTRLGKMPKSVRDTLSKIHKTADLRAEFKELYSIGINKYFNSLYTNDKEIKTFWKELQHLKPWNINDDSIEGEGCPKNNQGESNQIYDGGGISLFLITKKEIKSLNFYAPQHYDKICPGKKGREAILQIEEIFKKNFK